MLFSTAATVVSMAALTAANSISSAKSDLDGSVWQNVSPVSSGMTFTDHLSNRPVKRQSGWNPPGNLATPLKQVWDHCEKTYSDGNLYGFRNYGWDQLMATKGNINMCVRWESNQKVTQAQRAQVAAALEKSYQKWFKWVYGYDNFPFNKINIKVVGWAVRNRNILEGSTAGLDVYTDVDGEGIPQCAPACGRMFNQNGDYSGCRGGAARHYDQSLWLTDGMNGGAGGDWGQRIGREYFMDGINSDNIHILLHEMGHTFGLDDFYDWTPQGQNSFIMLAGSADHITDFDGWMFRNWWHKLSRNRGWQGARAAKKNPRVAEDGDEAGNDAGDEAGEAPQPSVVPLPVPAPEEPVYSPAPVPEDPVETPFPGGEEPIETPFPGGEEPIETPFPGGEEPVETPFPEPEEPVETPFPESGESGEEEEGSESGEEGSWW